MARTRPRGIKQPHPLGSVATRAGVSPLTVVSASSVTTSTGVKISELPPASSANGSDQFETNQGGISRRITVDQLLDVTGGAYLPLVGGETITPESGTTTRGLDIVQYGSGTGAVAFNNILVSENVDAGANFVSALVVDHLFGDMTGGRQAISAYATLQFTPNPATGNRNYCGLVGVAQALVPDNGTGTGYATSAGGIFGLGAAGVLKAGATNFANVTGAEFNTTVETGASVYAKSIIQLSGRSDDRVSGSGVDAMIWAYNHGSVPPRWNHGILFDYPGDATAFPFDSGTTVLATGVGTIGIGVDFSSSTVTTAAFKSPGFTVSGTGSVSAGGGISNGFAFEGWVYATQNLSGVLPTHTQGLSLGWNHAGGTGTVDYVNGFTTGFGHKFWMFDAGHTALVAAPVEMGALTGTTATFSGNTTFSGTPGLTIGALPPGTGFGGDGTNIAIRGYATGGVYIQSATGSANWGIFTTSGLQAPGLGSAGTVTAMNAVAIGAGANTQAFIKASSTANLGIYYGTGDPTFSAAKGSIYSKTDATTTTTRLWVNTTGSTTWATVTTSA